MPFCYCESGEIKRGGGLSETIYPGTIHQCLHGNDFFSQWKLAFPVPLFNSKLII